MSRPKADGLLLPGVNLPNMMMTGATDKTSCRRHAAPTSTGATSKELSISLSLHLASQEQATALRICTILGAKRMAAGQSRRMFSQRTFSSSPLQNHRRASHDCLVLHLGKKIDLSHTS